MKMNTLIYLSLACSAVLSAADIEIDTIAVESTTLEDVSGEEIKSADTAEALAKKVPSISLVRRSGIANDIILRGQKKDNINVLVDDAKIYGACPNRMDPTTSHIATNNIESIEVIEGPYDVENFGTLSGSVKIKTRKPTEELHGDVNLGYGSFDYKKAAASISGGTEYVKFLLSFSGERGGQYEDGNGDTFAKQVDNFILDNPAAAGAAYQDQYRDMDAFTKLTGSAKIFIDLTDDQELRFGYMANRSDDILYPSSKMDALYDDSNIYTAEYIIRNIGSVSKKLDFQYYLSDVEHPMSTEYRVSSTKPLPQGGVKVSKLTTQTQGIKVINTTEINKDFELKIGLDGSIRNWDGKYTVNGDPATTINPMWSDTSMNNVDTTNLGIFSELEQHINIVEINYGLRYDYTNVSPSSNQQENDYSSLNGNIFLSYETTPNITLFGGAGKATRVPDARELYFYGIMGNETGTPTLNQTTNYEIDLGMENNYEVLSLKTKLFYSILKDYIYYNSSKLNPKGAAINAFENIDATIYGIEITGSYYLLDNLYSDFGVAYQRGKKDTLTSNQTDDNLAEIPPLKGNIALNYLYYQESKATVEFVGADSWKNYDAENGEQELASWGIMNLKVDHKFPYGFGLAAGVDNVFDKTYAVSNTYKDLTLLSGGGDVMLMNEPGRYYYVNASYSF